MIPVFLSADNKYAPYLCVVIKSVCQNTNSNIDFFILDGEIDDSYKNMVKDVCSHYKKASVEFINPDSINIFRDCAVRNHISKTAFYRLLIPNLKPQFDKILYLDVDLIVNLDIEELFNQDIGDYIIGASYEECNEDYHTLCTKKSLGIDMKHKYFNSGVLLINCKKWRENNITQKLKDTYDEVKDRMIFHDQDLLNYLFSVNNYFLLDKKFNHFIQDSVVENSKEIIHFDASMKPWQFLPEIETDLMECKNLWWKTAQSTGYIDLLKEKCIYKDEITLRVARAAKAHQKMNKQKLVQMMQKRDVKISVIIPVYNAAKYLSKCLNSLISQTFKNFEVLCINDKSTDGSLKILEEFAQKDERIKVINNEKNIGAALARNIGIDRAEGKYIYFLDADDYIDEKYLECMAAKIEQQNCDVVLNLSVLSESDGNQNEYKHPSVPEINKSGEFIDNITIINDFPCFIWARMYRKAFLNEHKLRFLDIHTTDDVAFNVIVNVFADKTFVFCGENYHYTVSDFSLIGTAKFDNNIDLLHIKAHSLIYDYLKEQNKLDDRLKLFRVYPFMKVDSSEKFDFYKKFFEKIKEDFYKNESIYNEMEKYFAYSLLNTSTYEDYLKDYNKVVTIGFLRRKVRV